MRNIISGDELMVFIYRNNQYESIAFSTSHKLSISVSVSITSSHDMGIFSSVEPDFADWSITTENLMSEEADYLFKCMLEGTKLTLAFGIPDNFDENGLDDDCWTTSQGYQGKAILKSFRLSAQNGDIATYSAEFVGITSFEKTISPSYAPSFAPRPQPTISYPTRIVNVNYSSTNMYELPTLVNENGVPIRYVVGPTSSGRVVEDNNSTYLVTPEVGQITISAYFDGDEDYSSASAEVVYIIGEQHEDDSWNTQPIDLPQPDNTKKDGILRFDRENVTIEQNNYNVYDIEDLYNPYDLPITLSCINAVVGINQANWQITTSEIGEYRIVAYFEGNEQYNECSAGYNLKIIAAQSGGGGEPTPSKQNVVWNIDTSSMSVSTYTDETYQGTIKPISITPSTLASSVKVYLDDVLMDSTSFTLSAAGTHTIRYSFEGNEQYNASSTSYQIVYTKTARPDQEKQNVVWNIDTSSMSVSTYTDETYQGSIRPISIIPSSLASSVKVYLGNVPLVAGVFQLPIAGTYSIRYVFEGNEQYNASEISYQIVYTQSVRPEPEPSDYSTQYLTLEAIEATTFGYYSYANNIVQYKVISDNPNELTDWTISTLTFDESDNIYVSNSISVSAGAKVLWRATNLTINHDGILTFTSTAGFNVYGNILSLIYGFNFNQHNPTIVGYQFANLFRMSSTLRNANNLILPTVVTDMCYYEMFYGCAALRTAPALPATTLAFACYRQMFYGCSSLVNAPVLPATTLKDVCYSEMFYGCSSLVNAPALPATTLKMNCYKDMFHNCTSLVNAPVLPATVLSYGCYVQMFAGCTSLQTAPTLHATTLAVGCYWAMFRDCTSLVNAPVLPATTLVEDCYKLMFYGCSSLNCIKALFIGSTIPNGALSSWLSGTAANATFIKSPNNNYTRAQMNIPSNWTIVDDNT